MKNAHIVLWAMQDLVLLGKKSLLVFCKLAQSQVVRLKINIELSSES